MAGKEKVMAKQQGEEEKKEKGRGGRLPVVPLIIVILVLNLLVVGKVFLAAPAGVHGGKEAKKEKKTEEVGVKMTLEEFLVNLGGSGDHYLKTTLALGLKKGITEKQMEEEIAPIRDVIITVLSSTSLQQLASAEGRENLKQEMRRRINAELGEEKVVRIYFTAFATQ